jgi:TP901 family phage tail tape measure protein
MTTERIDIVVSETGARTVKRNLEELGQGAGSAASAVELLKKGLAFLGVAEGLRRAAKAATEFGDAMAEVSTVLPDTSKDLGELAKQAKLMAVEFGSMPTQQAKAFYEILSAGISDAASATLILRESNKLAVGGVTDVAVAADGLTSVLSAYGLAASKASDVSNAMFVAAAAGKTTIKELADNVGKVAPLAAQMGVSFDEVASAIGALTKGGVSTAESVTGLKAILASVAKPTEEARHAAKQLGLQFDAAAIQSRGLGHFLEEVAKKTGGGVQPIAQLFGGVEALVPVLAFAGVAGKDFSNTMEDMGKKVGKTDAAFAKIAAGPGFEMRRALAALQVIMTDLGDTIMGPLVPGLKLLADHMEDAKKVAMVAAAAIAVAFGTEIVAAFRTATTAVLVFNAAMLANPYVAVAAAIVGIVTALVAWRNEIKPLSDSVATLGDFGTAAFTAIGKSAEWVISTMRSEWPGAFDYVTARVAGSTDVMLGAFRVLGDSVKAWGNLAINTIRAVAKGGLSGDMEEMKRIFSEDVIGGWISSGVEGAVQVGNAWRKEAEKVAAERKALETPVATVVPPSASLVPPPGSNGGGIKVLTDEELRKAKELKEQYKALRSELDPLWGASNQVAEAQKTVNKAFSAGLITVGEKAQMLEQLVGKYKDLLDPLGFINQGLDREIGLLALEKGARADAIQLYDVELQLRDKNVKLTETERAGLALKINHLREANEALQRQDGLLKEIRGPQQDYVTGVEALNRLLQDGKITAEEYGSKLRDMQIDVLEGNKDMVSGMQRGMLKMQREFNDFASAAESAVVNSFKKMEDSLTQFVMTGKFGIGDLVNTILSELARLAIRQAVVAPLMNAFQSILGSVAGNIFGSLGGSTPVSGAEGASALHNSSNGWGAGPNYTPVEVTPLNHLGAIVGNENEASGFRALRSGTFNNALRYHTGGIAGNEVPTVLTRGEGVFTPGQMQALGGMGSKPVQVTVINNTPNSEVKTREVADGRGGMNIEVMIEEVAARSIRRPGGALNRAVKETFPSATQKVVSR